VVRPLKRPTAADPHSENHRSRNVDLSATRSPKRTARACDQFLRLKTLLAYLSDCDLDPPRFMKYVSLLPGRYLDGLRLATTTESVRLHLRLKNKPKLRPISQVVTRAIAEVNGRSVREKDVAAN
jgi:hypothetical protein